MNNAAIISIGNELLNGHTVNTNSSWLCGRLLTISVPVVYNCDVGDDIGQIKNAIEYAFGKADIILITGGLGPTDDDLTRNGIAQFLNVKLEYHSEIEEKIKKFFAARNYPMPEKNKVQAYLPAGTGEIENSLGTAPGIFYKNGKKIIAAFPGVPSEMKQMFDESVLPKLKEISSSDFLIVRKVRCIGTGESTIVEMLGDSMNRDRNPLINCTVDHGIITLHIVAKAKDKKNAETMAAKDIEKLSGLLGSLVYGLDEQSLAEVVGQKLLEKKKTLALAESCTGGLIAKIITDVPGSSGYFTYGWVTYSNEAKISELGVEKSLIEQFGAVSAEAARAMAAGARKKANSNYAIAATGIAGPQGGSEKKPVGLVYISIASDKGVDTEKFLFGPRNRDFIRLRTCQNALNLLRL
ncbi:MAG: competence/damage-inducible protein A, partial [Planctomycetes bacterium]|nr:competence/damage-inducible protein A [Planctomycetota bacterium]